MSAHNNISQKAEGAVVAYLKAKTFTRIAAANIHEGLSTGENEDDKSAEQVSNEMPRVVVHADSSEEAILQTGVFNVNLSVYVENSADDVTSALHEEDAGEVFNEIITDAFATDINTTDFTCLGFVPLSQGSAIDGRTFQSMLTFQLVCCGSDLSA